MLIGSGGREHALAWKLSTCPGVEKIFSAPGNGGMAKLCERVALESTDIEGLAKFAKENAVDLTVVGPEAPLAAGIVDQFTAEGLRIFGPTKAAARLESSKAFAKEFMKKNKIPTAPFKIFEDADKAKKYLDDWSAPKVVKADGLAAGKGVVVCSSKDEALKAVDDMMTAKVFGDAGAKIVIEDKLEGEEASLLFLCDGESAVPLAPAQDHKRVNDGDDGPNTGGMGAYSPTPSVGADVERKVMDRIVRPTLKGMAADGAPYKGVLYVGLMLSEGEPMVIEYNCRFGDPETQAVLPRLKSNLVEAMDACIDGKAGSLSLEWDPRLCVCVVLASAGYPGEYEKGKLIQGLDEAGALPDVIIFHAGTDVVDGRLVSMGGRVMNVVGMGSSAQEALLKTFEAVTMVDFDNKHFRTDIAYRVLVAESGMPAEHGPE